MTATGMPHRCRSGTAVCAAAVPSTRPLFVFTTPPSLLDCNESRRWEDSCNVCSFPTSHQIQAESRWGRGFWIRFLSFPILTVPGQTDDKGAWMFLKACAFALISATAYATCTVESSNLDHAYRSMYNLDFSRAQQQLQEWEQSHPSEPLDPVSQAASYLFAELDRLGSLQSQLFVNDQQFEKRKQLAPDGQTKSLFQNAINRATTLAAKKLADDPGRPQRR
jgi:hypothetical protein